MCVVLWSIVLFFFFKQETAYDLRISDWSSDVCSSDLVSTRVLTRLKRGEYAVQDELDLHGLNEAAARKLLQAFLANARRERWQCLRIIHGKGLSSERGESVLRPLVAHLLSQRGEVLAFATAPQNQGGGGATLVLVQGTRGNPR